MKKYKIPPDLVRDVANAAGTTQETARTVINALLNDLMQRPTTSIRGFGTFYHKTIAAHRRTNPRKPDEVMDVAQTTRLTLRKNRSH